MIPEGFILQVKTGAGWRDTSLVSLDIEVADCVLASLGRMLKGEEITIRKLNPVCHDFLGMIFGSPLAPMYFEFFFRLRKTYDR